MSSDHRAGGQPRKAQSCLLGQAAEHYAIHRYTGRDERHGADSFEKGAQAQQPALVFRSDISALDATNLGRLIADLGSDWTDLGYGQSLAGTSRAEDDRRHHHEK